MDVVTGPAITIDNGSNILTELRMMNDTLKNNQLELSNRLETLQTTFNDYSTISLGKQYVIEGVLLFCTVCFVIAVIYKFLRVFI